MLHTNVELKSVNAHFDTKLRAVSKILVNITSPGIDSLQQACFSPDIS
jgi:hypothetical protein